MARLPMRSYWMLAIIGSLALHAAALGAGLHFLGGPQKKRDVTEIRFAAAPQAATLRAAQPAETTRLAAEPSAETVARATPAETLKPLTAEPAPRVASVEQAAPVSPTEPAAAARPPVESIAPIRSEPAASGPEPERMAPASTTETAMSPTSAPVVPSTPAETLAASRPEPPTAPVVDRESLVAASSESAPERIAHLPAEIAETAAVAPAERLTAAPQDREAVAALPRSEAETLTGSAPQAEPAERLPAAPPNSETVAALPRPAAETAPVAAPTAEAVQGSAPQAEPAERLSAAPPNSETVAALPRPVAEMAPVATPTAEAVQGSAPQAATTERLPAARQNSETVAASPRPAAETAPVAAPTAEAEQRSAPEAAPSVAPGAGGTVPTAIAPLPSTGATISPVGGEARETVTASLFAPSLPGAALGVDTDKPTDLYRQAVDFVGRFEGGDCFVALPSVDRGGKVEFKAFGKDEGREKAFAAAYRSAIGLDAAINLGDINGPQCAALGFARSAARYPDFGLILDLDAAEVTSGEAVSGSILSVKNRQLHALVVDDEGRIQAIDSLLVPRANGSDRQFAIPVFLTNGPVATKQLLIAIASDKSLPSLDGETNTTAVDDFFHRLEGEVARTGAAIDIAIAGFSVVPEPPAAATP